MNFAFHYGRYRLTRLPFWIVPADDLCQQKIDKICQELSNVFDIADEIVI